MLCYYDVAIGVSMCWNDMVCCVRGCHVLFVAECDSLCVVML